MEENVLKNIVAQYKLQKRRRDELKAIKKDITELKKNEFVKKYLNLIKKLDSNNNKKMISEQEMLYKIFQTNRSSIKESNNIFVYLGTFQYSYDTDVEHGSYDYRVARENIDANYSAYENLETEKVLNIAISKRDIFEKENIIVFPQQANFEQAEFYKLQKLFISYCVKDNQTIAVAKILKKGIKNLK